MHTNESPHLSRQQLSRKIQVCGFAMGELTLYLDTHPTDTEAIERFKRYQALKNEALAEYSAMYGPIQADHFHGTERWNWIDNPWPWEE